MAPGGAGNGVPLTLLDIVRRLRARERGQLASRARRDLPGPLARQITWKRVPVVPGTLISIEPPAGMFRSQTLPGPLMEMSAHRRPGSTALS